MSELEWYKSSYSGGSTGNCIEVALSWHKSSYSANTGGNCVEVRQTPEAVLVRDTQHREQGHLSVPAGEWSAFLAGVRSGEL